MWFTIQDEPDVEGLFGSSDEEGWAPLKGPPGPWDADGFICVGI